MTLSRADAFLYKQTLDEDSSNRQLILRSEIHSGGFMALGVWNLIECIWESGKSPFYKKVRNYIRWGGTSNGYENAHFLEELRLANEDKLYELLQDCVQWSVSENNFISNRYAILVWNGLDIHRYYPWAQDKGESLDRYICSTKKALPIDHEKTFSDGMQELVTNIRDVVNENMRKETISPDGIIIDDTVVIYTALDSYLPWEVFLEIQEKPKERKKREMTPDEEIPWFTNYKN